VRSAEALQTDIVAFAFSAVRWRFPYDISPRDHYLESKMAEG